MRGARGLVVTLLLVGSSLVSASGAIAAKAEKELVLESAKGVLAPGQEIALSSTELVFENSGGERLACSRATLTGTLTTNESMTVAASFTEGLFGSEPEPGCERNPPIFPMELVPFAPVALPWNATFSYNGSVVLSGTEGVAVEVKPYGVPACRWEAKKFRGRLERSFYGARVLMPSPLEKLTAPKDPRCSTRGPLNNTKADLRVTWDLTSEGEPVTIKNG